MTITPNTARRLQDSVAELKTANDKLRLGDDQTDMSISQAANRYIVARRNHQEAIDKAIEEKREDAAAVQDTDYIKSVADGEEFST